MLNQTDLSALKNADDVEILAFLLRLSPLVTLLIVLQQSEIS